MSTSYDVFTEDIEGLGADRSEVSADHDSDASFALHVGNVDDLDSDDAGLMPVWMREQLKGEADETKAIDFFKIFFNVFK